MPYRITHGALVIEVDTAHEVLALAGIFRDQPPALPLVPASTTGPVAITIIDPVPPCRTPRRAVTGSPKPTAKRAAAPPAKAGDAKLAERVLTLLQKDSRTTTQLTTALDKPRHSPRRPRPAPP